MNIHGTEIPISKHPYPLSVGATAVTFSKLPVVGWWWRQR